MLLKVILLLVIGVAGWALGRARPKVELIMFVLTVFAAVTAHSGMQFAFVNGRLDHVLGSPRGGAFEGAVFLIAAGEAVGMWLPFLLVPWAPLASRFWAALYALASATLAAVLFYFPFDFQEATINAIFVGADGPPYLLLLFACVPIAGVGFLVGLAKARSDDAGKEEDDDWSGPMRPSI